MASSLCWEPESQRNVYILGNGVDRGRGRSGRGERKEGVRGCIEKSSSMFLRTNR